MHDLSIGCMNEKIGTILDKTIESIKQLIFRKMVQVRVRIEMDLHKSISSGRTINIQGCRFSIALIYEKLSRICFCCGRIIYKQQACEGDKHRTTTNIGKFGAWLREKNGQKGGKPLGTYVNQSNGSNENQNRVLGILTRQLHRKGQTQRRFIGGVGNLKRRLRNIVKLRVAFLPKRWSSFFVKVLVRLR